MLTSLRTRADDVRALAGAVVLGSSAGLVIGVAYLFGGPAKPALPVPAIPGTVQAWVASGPVANPALMGSIKLTAVPKPPSGFAVVLRHRFGVEAGFASFAARPFQLRQAGDAPADLRCLTEAVYFEARGEATAGQQAVAQVVLNRVRHPAFPKTICAVVHQHTGAGCQFSFACSSRQASVDSSAWRRAQTVAAGEMHGAVMAAVGDATHFQTAGSGPFAGLLKVAQIGAHIFYRFGGRAGAPAMFHQTPSAPSTPAEASTKIELAKLDPAPTKDINTAVTPHKASAESASPAPSDHPAVTTVKPVSTVMLADPKPEIATHVTSPPAPVSAKAGDEPPARSAPVTLALAQS